MQIFAIVYDSTGTKLGAGELISAHDFEHTRRLSRAGRFAVSLALADPRLLDAAPDGRPVLCEKRVILIYGAVLLEGGSAVVRELGGGVVDRIARLAPDTLRVEGDDLLRELTYRSVLGLQNFAISEQAPGGVKLQDASTDPPVYTNLPNTFDGNPATSDDVHLQEQDSFLLVGGLQPFLTMRFDLGALTNNNPAEMNFGFGTGEDSFSEIEPFSDGTLSGGDPLHQDGTIRWTSRPGAWDAVTIDSATLYWIRMDPTATLDIVTINEIYLGVAVPTTSDLSNIMAFAPPGWSLNIADWYGSTTAGSFYRFSDENVLEALIKTAEITGEHFRLGDGRVVEWMRKDLPDSGVVATQVTDPTSDAAQVCYIENLEEIIESYELATRVYGEGAGNGTEALTFADKTESDPAGYVTAAQSVIQTDTETEQYWYIQSTAGVATYGRIETFYYNKSIRSADGYSTTDVASANTLWKAALEWLQKHDRPQYFYRLSVGGLQTELKVGTTIRVQYRRATEDDDGLPVVAWDIDEDLIIIETINRVGSNGAYTVGLIVSTVADWYTNDALQLAKIKRDQKDYQNHNQGISRYNVR